MHTENNTKLYETLEKGILNVTNNEQWKKYLKTLSKFHSYSFNNTILIYSQKPEATYVAGYYKWKNEFHRYVKKGEKGIRIFAPIKKKIKEEESKIFGFKAATVFDISQTEGDPLPDYIDDSLYGKVKDYDDFINILMLASPAPIHIHPMHTKAHGFYDSKTNTIEIRDDLSEIMTIKTCIHEIAHALLHKDETQKDQYTKETEAESVAFAVCSYFGIDTSEYSFPYLAGWSKNHDTSELKESIEAIQKTTSQIIYIIKTIQVSNSSN